MPAAPKPRSTQDVVDVRASDGVPPAADVRAILESAADVIFSDGISAEFLDQWTFETVQLLEQRVRRGERVRTAEPLVGAARRPVSAGH